MIDGYDIGAIAFAAPHLIADWHVPPKALGLVLSASNIGVLFGSQIFGWIGDRYGRKTALIPGNLLFGVFTFIAAYSTDLTEMTCCGSSPGSASAASFRMWWRSTPNPRRATCARRSRSSPPARCPLGGAIAGFVSAASGADVWLADFVRYRRHRADRHRARRHHGPAGIDQIHGAARKPARQNGSAASRRSAPTSRCRRMRAS